MRLNFQIRALPNLHNPQWARRHYGYIMTTQISLSTNQGARYIGRKPKPYNNL